jgi:2-dehydro-3-deoxyglucarate aldolase
MDIISQLKKIKTDLKNKKTTVGSWMQIPDSSVAEIMGKSGFDWVVVDLEHGRFSQQILPDLFRALELGGTVPFARLQQSDSKEIKQALDAGALGIILPMIENADQLEKAISAAYYPPKGTRGVGYCRANLFGKGFNKYVKNTANDIVIVAQIEHINAVNDLDRILRVSGLDAIIVGPYDLSASMGITAKFESKAFLDVMENIRQKANFHDIPMGVHIVLPDEEALKNKIKNGYQFIAYAIDSVFLYQSAQRPELGET